MVVPDNEISIDQSRATLNTDIEQLGSGNLIGGVYLLGKRGATRFRRN